MLTFLIKYIVSIVHYEEKEFNIGKLCKLMKKHIKYKKDLLTLYKEIGRMMLVVEYVTDCYYVRVGKTKLQKMYLVEVWLFLFYAQNTIYAIGKRSLEQVAL